ncbi:CPBP family intramembrane metalloprotease [Flammeovirga yaeyamensis]|uniref:CPBP family intramembrane metalloprotease n=1 Tax=Flammeovirga yaeyamensis TaxID=367791 RepID=A0AAX1N244_9BACT|nr:type II CAAX endopeptidase family protein [Flammeovirga yaeyamensis]MBB3696039.1 hypothetical protein [Flammeovirga yaeyamensis]NMF34725.1 CPBP family intramembrane metalloprotease [Flammeovirga yaeyamensis]QWG00446.1 CPBP family intramembrane metalloprotease [Flammeovirga yaeyamensis]
MNFNLKITRPNEPFPDKIKYQLKDIIAFLSIPLMFINGYVLLTYFDLQKETVAVADALLRGFLFFILIYLYKDVLQTHWKYFNQSKRNSWLLVILGGILLQIIISITKKLLPEIDAVASQGTPLFQNQNGLPEISFSLFLITLGPVFTSLIEDITFRYLLLHKLFLDNKIWRVVLVVFNAVIFGLIHYNNFGGHIIATVSFMTAGLFLNLIYLYTRNIWHVFLIHCLNNFILSVLGLFIVWGMQLLQ